MRENELLSIRDLRVSIPTDEGLARVLTGVELAVPRGKIVGVAGESGCGKSTLIRAILRILPPRSRIESGQILLNGEDLLALPEQEVEQRIRGRTIGFIPQDPYLAFNPVFKVGDQLLEILRWHGLPGEEASRRYTRAIRGKQREHLISVFRAVQLADPELALERYPHQFSGGQRQRLLIAGALASQPDFVLADEPTTALDVTTQLQILKLLKELAEQFNVSMLFVSHDFGVLAQLCDSVSVMYAGQTVESGTTENIIQASKHPYTRLLLRCHPDRSDDLEGIPGQVPSPLVPITGCYFHPRCPHRMPECSMRRPLLKDHAADGHLCACWLHCAEET